MKTLGALLFVLLLSPSINATPLNYKFDLRLDGIGAPGIFGLTAPGEIFSGHIKFSSLMPNLTNAIVTASDFSATVGDTTWTYNSLLTFIYVDTNALGEITKINSLTASTPLNMFSIVDSSNVSWYALDKVAGDSCSFWPISTVSGPCAYGGGSGALTISAAVVAEPDLRFVFLGGIAALWVSRHKNHAKI